MKRAVVVGAGPAGLMAAETLADAHFAVTVIDQKPSVGRKFLMAGKSGLNLTKSEPLEQFLAAYGAHADVLAPMISQFGPQNVVAWAEALGREVFVGSSKRVFPKEMKASPLLRAWLARLTDKGVDIRTRHRFHDISTQAVHCETVDGSTELEFDVAVFAMGGASWSRLGSDGAWTNALVDVANLKPFQPSNMGFAIDWSTHMHKHFGTPVKNVRLKAGDKQVRGEFVISSRGVEGGGIYQMSSAMRDGHPMTLDLFPDVTETALREKLSRPRGSASLATYLRKTLKINPVKMALLNEFGRPFPEDMAVLLKDLPINHRGPFPLDEAISTVGGLSFSSLSPELMLKALPGVFAAGEMLDWDAPTGGYLITACLATGLWAGQNAAVFAS